MTKFLKYCLFILISIILLLCLLDLLYTEVYKNAFPRNKTQYILSLDENEKLDYVFLGSSRVENFVISSEIENQTGRRTLNLGTQGAKLDDMTIFLRLLVENKVKIERLFVQVDYIYNFESNSDIVRSQSLPYIRNNSVIKDYLKRVDADFHKNYYIPFYRYVTNDYRIGFREVIASAIDKKSNINFEDGFVPLNGIMRRNGVVGGLPKTIAESNKNIIEIDAICKANNIEVTYFCAPFCSGYKTSSYILKLKRKLPNFVDFSKAIPEHSLFQNCSHLNEEGALVFTNLLIKRLNL
ncbi:hypothetical protein Q4566_01005 [Tamlana sp. 2_MG-2023]|uniref:hypothetical protein n=1 Tax=unclassified Tamlana TaxID=2614803 RepID=UPI0026E273B3|nr:MULTISPECIES: hypothetical protein [unclassified Tamlana]MDO6758762.1 hypothetical protein [Tamlana sp. 2_MG-2023]MDO6789461.1 hypothetical protein [Tamlana sp. 1_MG-2023]